LEVIFPDVDSVSGASLLSVGVASGFGKVPGALVANFKLLFSAYDVTRNPSLLVYRAVPMLDSAARMGLAIKAEIGLPFAFMATPDDKGRLYQVGMLDELDL